MKNVAGQLTLRGIAIGIIGCVIITASSAYTALKMGALPWPIIFAAIVSLFFLKAISKNQASLNEANVTHTIMSAGAMVAGGLAFTIPGAWMLGMADQISIAQMLVIALSGTVLGLICTATLRRHYIEEAGLEFPIGEAAAQTLKAGESGGATGRKLFGSMGFAALFTFLRDGLAAIPALVGTLPIPGIVFGVYLSPMMMAVGFLVGTSAVLAWFLGAVVGNLGIITGGSTLGLWDLATGQAMSSSLGMGLMMGCGFAVIVKDILPKGLRILSSLNRSQGKAEGTQSDSMRAQEPRRRFAITAGLAALAVAAIVLLLSLALGLPPLASVAIVLLTFVTTAMSAQSVGQTGIDPMEIFGLIVLLLVAAFANVAQVQLFFVAAVVAVACGLAGDVMNDFRAGHVLGTSPKAQWLGQAIGGVLGALVSVAVMVVLLEAYGPDAFGPGTDFVATQASVVAAMVSGIPHVPAFAAGVLVGFALYCAKLPAMMLGLGVYLPFYLSLTAFLGCLAKLAYDQIQKRRIAALPASEREAHTQAAEASGIVVASGLLGGESIMGIILALAAVISGIAL